MIKLYNFDELKPEEILNRDIRAEKNVEDVVDGIIADVRARGDEALKDYALKFDGAKIENLQVTQAEIDEAFANMDPYFLETLREAAANIESFHRQQVHKNFVVNDKPGIVLGQKYTPIQRDAGLVVDHKVFVQLLFMEVADVLGGHLQRRDELGIGLFQLGKGFLNFGLADPHVGQLGVVEFGGVLDQGGVAAGADVRNNRIDGGLHVGLGANVTVQNFLGAYLIKVIQTDHFARASFILFSSSVSWAYLNL